MDDHGQSRNLTPIYEELCRAHDGIAEFRAKLLALLPIASAGGIFLLMANVEDETSLTLLLPIGVFGFLVTIGLFIYELRGIQQCNAFIGAADRLEREMVGGLGVLGAFAIRPKSVFGVGATGAALVIYSSVAGAWAYVAGLGFGETVEPTGSLFAAAAGIGVIVAIVGRSIVWKHNSNLKSDLEKVDTTLAR